MRTLYPLGIIYAALILSSCAIEPTPAETVTTTHTVTPRKDPINISMTSTKPNRPYKVLGKAQISKFNPVGIKRQEATMRDLMRQMAAAANGDALIEVRNHDKTISATVIAYKQISV